jgi:hypothetical protein
MNPTQQPDELEEMLVGLFTAAGYMLNSEGAEAVAQSKVAIERMVLERAITELEKISEQYGEFRDETLGKPIDLKAVTLYRIKHRITELKKQLQGEK